MGLRIISWNCQGAFRIKAPSILAYKPDICIIQECENPYHFRFKDQAIISSQKLWIGRNNSKGIGVFVFNDNLNLEPDNWENHGIEHFLPFFISGKRFIGVWACNNYIEDLYTYFSIHKNKLNSTSIICGDFNSSSIWDNQRRRKIRSHQALVNMLEQAGLYSAYHAQTALPQGKEEDATFFLHRDRKKPYHIDYVFCDKNRLGGLNIGRYVDWNSLSDHMPLLFTYRMGVIDKADDSVALERLSDETS